MKRFALVVLAVLSVVGCNTDGFEELQSVYSENHKGETYVNTVPNTTPSTPPSTDTKPALCKSLTPKTCQQIRNENYRPNSPTSLTDGCVEVQQQETCFGDKDRDAGGVKDGFLCEAQYGKNCRATTTN